MRLWKLAVLLPVFAFFMAYGASWDSLTFPIMAWWGPPASIVNDTVLQGMADAGFTASLTFASREENLHMLSLAHKYGLKLSIYDSRINPKEAVDSAALKRIDSVVMDYKDSAALLGYHIIDEPSAALFANIAAIKSRLNEKDPDHLAYVNLLPTYASTAQLGSGSYQEHVDDYMRTVRPQMLSYDNYCITTGGLRSDYYENLEIIRRAALANKVPFWAFTLSTPHWSFPMPTEGHIRFQLYSDLVYGAKGLQYFTYGLPPSDETITFFLAPINPDGSKTPLWAMTQHVNHEILNLAPILKKLTSLNVYHSSPLPQGTHALPADYLINTVSGGSLVVGDFKDPSDVPYLMLVNRDYTNSATMLLSGTIDSMVEISKTTGLELQVLVKDANHHFTLQFGAGEGRLFRIISTDTSIEPALPNIALGKSVTASSSYESSDWGKAKLTDGAQTSVPGTRGYTTECISASQVQAWVQVDLGADTTFNRVILYPRLNSESGLDSAYLHSGSLTFPVDFTLLAITAAGDTQIVKTIAAYPNTDKFPLTLDFPDAKARYVRLFATNFGTDGSCLRMQLAEMEVYNRLITTIAGESEPVLEPAAVAEPNPFNPSVSIHYRLPAYSEGQYRIFNLQGRLVYRKVLSGSVSPLGILVWNGTDLEGRKVPSGVYLGCLETAGRKARPNRLLLVK